MMVAPTDRQFNSTLLVQHLYSNTGARETPASASSSFDPGPYARTARANSGFVQTDCAIHTLFLYVLRTRNPETKR